MKLLVPCKLLLLGALNIFCGRWELVGRSGESDQDSALEAVFPPPFSYPGPTTLTIIGKTVAPGSNRLMSPFNFQCPIAD